MALDPGYDPPRSRRYKKETTKMPVPQFGPTPTNPPSKFTPQPGKELYHRTVALFSQLEELIDFNPAIVKGSTPKEWKAKLRDLKDELDLIGVQP